MHNLIIQSFQFFSSILEIIGAASLIIGFAITTLKCFYQLKKESLASVITNYRKSVGRVILIGLEVLVAATIIKMFTLDETLMSITLLAITIAIRIMIAWSIELEMNSRWPWQNTNTQLTKHKN